MSLKSALKVGVTVVVVLVAAKYHLKALDAARVTGCSELANLTVAQPMVLTSKCILSKDHLILKAEKLEIGEVGYFDVGTGVNLPNFKE